MTTKRISRVYKDIDLSFVPHPITKDLKILKNESAIRRSVRNIVQTIPTERFFNPILGSDVHKSLFDFVDFGTASTIQDQIEIAINNFEPRARLVAVRANPDYDRNSYEVSIEFYVVNTPTELVDMTVMLERLR